MHEHTTSTHVPSVRRSLVVTTDRTMLALLRGGGLKRVVAGLFMVMLTSEAVAWAGWLARRHAGGRPRAPTVDRLPDRAPLPR